MSQYLSSNGVSSEMTAALEMIKQLKAENDALKAAKQRPLTYKVSDKGAVSVYGLGRFPVTLYRSQWEKLMKDAAKLQAFITENAERLTTKE